MAVTIQSFAYHPNPLALEVGDSVRVTNLDGATHTYTDSGGAFDSGDLATNEVFTWRFTTAGTFDIVCSIHSSMGGRVTVTA